MEEAKASLQSEEQRLNELRQSAETLDQSSKQLLQDILTRQRQMQEDAQNARAADTRLRTLKELQDGYEGYQYSVKNALSYAKKQQLSGVRGVVAMLLQVPKEYETAMDMALGGAMQNIVTETEQDAKRLIEYLRQNRLGRATFLPLSTVHGRTLNPNERRVLNMPGCVGVASELCRLRSRIPGHRGEPVGPHGRRQRPGQRYRYHAGGKSGLPSGDAAGRCDALRWQHDRRQHSAESTEPAGPGTGNAGAAGGAEAL